jgi:DNA-binding CsgD family transcriptional regulator
LNSLLNAKTLSSFGDAFASAIRPFGINAFAIGQIPAADGLGKLFLVRWPQWIEYYAVNGFVHEDIAVDETRRSLEPFTWAELKKRRPGEGTRVFEECSAFGWHDGLIVPVDGPDSRRGLVTLPTRSSVLSLGATDRTELINLALVAYATCWTLAVDSRGTTLTLSAREKQALIHVADGRDDSEIALLMSISKSTAHAHVERAKRRLGANTRAKAVAIAVAANLI